MSNVCRQATHAKEIQVLRGRISTLQTTVDDLTTQKTSLFDQLQARQAELELATSEKSAVSLQLSEAQFQLRETSERASTLEEELADARRRASAPATSLNGASPASSAETSVATSRQLASAALAYESKLSDLRTRISRLETERAEAEEEWSRNVQERTKEVERLRRVTDDKDREYEEAVRSRRAREERVYDLEKERETLAKEVERERRKGEEGWERMRKVADEEVRPGFFDLSAQCVCSSLLISAVDGLLCQAAAREEIKDLATKISSLETSLAESKTQLQTLRQSSRVSRPPAKYALEMRSLSDDWPRPRALPHRRSRKSCERYNRRRCSSRSSGTQASDTGRSAMDHSARRSTPSR
jgi:chromosome segregation ATPase